MYMRIAIVGYGNLGQGAELALRDCRDCEAVGVFTRRNPAAIRTRTGIPVYPAADILAMGEAATAHKLYHTTYCNHLMAWARRATADELEGITYGAELPADLAANMEAILNAVG